MDSSLIPPDELKFLLRWLEAGRADDDWDTIDAILDLSASIASDAFLPHYKESDRTEPTLTPTGVHILPAIGAALREYANAGFFAAGFDEQLGGLGLSAVVTYAILAQFSAANIATAAYPMLTAANARLIATFGSAAQIEQFALPQIAGHWFGTMCLSEPQAGSSLGDILTRATAEGKDTLGERFRLTGNKMWISGGDQDVSDNIIHLVLAKIPQADGSLPPGTKGISLFIVPKVLPDGQRNDIAIAGLNHKMGYRGTSNCLLNFGETIGATGWLIGEPGKGIAQMFQMMNEARIAVGVGAAALGFRGHRISLCYAQERSQGRLAGGHTGLPVAIFEHPDIKWMLLAQKAYTEGALGLCLYCASLVDRPQETDAGALLSLLTPVAKTWSAEYCLKANDLAIQIHGGYGYTRDFDVEQLYRDNRLNAIHEGTTGIQAADLLGRKILRDGPFAFDVATTRVMACVAEASKNSRLAGRTEALTDAWRSVVDTVNVLRSVERQTALDNATMFLRAFGHTIVAWLWIEQILAAERAESEGRVSARFVHGKERACRYFFDCELPKVRVWLAVVSAMTDVASGASIDEFC
jgi:alkylation response protein AidB-like acyl-CoA dehydrogenase